MAENKINITKDLKKELKHFNKNKLIEMIIYLSNELIKLQKKDD